jgi:diguanylate cyclase (GGDEF)-like protein
MTLEDRLRLIGFDKRSRVRIEMLLRRSEPAYPSHPGVGISNQELVAGGPPPDLLSGTADLLASNYGIALDREYPHLKTLRGFCNHLPAPELLPLLAACSQYLRSLPRIVTPVPAGDFETRLNAIFQEHDIRVRLIDGSFSDSDGALIADSDLDQKSRILLSPASAERHFRHLLEELSDDQLPIAVLFFDIDMFKAFNSKYTEAVVDRTILLDAQRLCAALSLKRGYAYRHGGDEFVMVLPNHDQQEAMAFAERLRHTFEIVPFVVDGAAEMLTISVGVAVYPQHGSIYQEVLEAANHAERSAKESGRNRVCVAR